MSLWLIVPRDPLIFRDGKPFTATPGERSKSLGFPFPSTLAGAVRTLVGPDPQNGYDPARVEYLKGIAVRGPALVELTAEGQISNWFFPAPADALVVEKQDSKEIRRYALTPFHPPKDAATDLIGLTLVSSIEHVKDKPYSKAPRYWNRSAMEKWLEHAGDDVFDAEASGIPDIAREYRTHVSIETGTQTSREGALFQTSGMEFAYLAREEGAPPEWSKTRSFALAIETDADLKAAADFLGGERRVARWQNTQDSLPPCPDKVRQAITDQKYCRLILATPAHFEKGYLPEYLESKLGAEVVAVALPRYQTISGWDYAKPKGGEPKPTRRLAPAGSVYFLNLEHVTDIEAFVNAIWLQAVSDDEQSRRDGFGLALLGAWDGVVRHMEVKS